MERNILVPLLRGFDLLMDSNSTTGNSTTDDNDGSNNDDNGFSSLRTSKQIAIVVSCIIFGVFIITSFCKFVAVPRFYQRFGGLLDKHHGERESGVSEMAAIKGHR
jgi:hypothetical protein